MDVAGNPTAIDFVKWCDNNRFDITRIGYNGGANRLAITFNSGTPASDVGAGGQRFTDLTTDAATSDGSTVALQINTVQEILIRGWVSNLDTSVATLFNTHANVISYYIEEINNFNGTEIVVRSFAYAFQGLRVRDAETTAVASAGAIRLPQLADVMWRNAADNGDVNGMFVDALDRVVIADESQGAVSARVDGPLELKAVVFSSLGTPADGTFRYCSDCLVSNPCAASGNGAFAKRLNGAWNCAGGTDLLEGALSNIPRWIFKQVDHGDMTTAGTADDFVLWTLPANTMIHDVVGTVVTAWEAAVGLSAAVCSVGTAAGSANDLTLDDNFFATGTRYELHDATASGGKGALLYDSTDKFAPFMLVASGDIEIQCDLTGDDHADTNAGQARIYILVSQPLGNTTTEAN